MKNQGQNPIFLKDYSAPNFLVETIDLHIDLVEEDTVVTSSIEFKQNPAVKGLPNLVLHGEEH